MKSPYDLDRFLGLEYYSTDTKGINGKLRTLIEDFCVREISDTFAESKDGEYTHFTLEKWNWETMRAIKEIARALGVSHKRFGYAGTKDKRAITKQRVSVWKIEEEDLKKVKIKDIKLSDFKKSDKRITLGNAAGNEFKIVIRGMPGERKAISQTISETLSQIKVRGVPNYFGYQRFGILRPNTHVVGKELIKGNLEGAVMAYLTKPFPMEREDAYEARKSLEDTQDFKKALKIFPKRLGYEIAMLNALSKNPNDFAGALRRLPKKLRWMFVHGYQSYLYNKILSRMLREGMEIKGKTIPLLGYESSFGKGRREEIERGILDKEGIALENFKIASMPELSSKGLGRMACIDIEPKVEILDDEINAGKKKCRLEFSLSKGSYATVVLREFMKAEPINY